MNVHGKIIVVRRNGTDSAHFPLTSSCCVFGRNQECDIRIQLPSVDEEQCRVEVDSKGHVFAKNLSKSTPTLVNDTALSDNLTALSHGDIISIVGRRFRFEFPVNSRFYPQKSPRGKSPKSPGMNTSTPGSASKSPRSSGRTPKPLSPRTDNVPDTKAAKSPQAETKSSPRTPALLKNSASAHASPDFLFGLSPTSFYKVSVTPKGFRKLSDVHQSKTNTPVFNMTPSTSAQTPLLFKDAQVASPAKKAVGSPYAKSNASLRKSISDLRRKSMPVVEAEEDSSTPSKTPPVKETEKPKQLSGTKRRYSEFVIPSSKRKRVSFGPSLSPEHFDKCLPPKTPIKKGATPSRISQGPKSLLKRKSPKNNTSVAKSPSPGKSLTPSQASKQVSPVQQSSGDASMVNDSSFSNENIKTTPKRRSLSRSPPADRKSPKASSPVLETITTESARDGASSTDTNQILTPEKHDIENILSDKSKSADRGTVGKATAKPYIRRAKSLDTSSLGDITTIGEKKVRISAISPKSHSPHVKTPVVKRAGGQGKTNKTELDISLTGVKELLKTPKTSADVSFTGISPLFKTPNEAQKSQKHNANLNNSTPKMVKPANYIDTPRPNFSEKRSRSPKKFFDEIVSTSYPVKSPKSPLLGTPSWKSKKLEKSQSPMKIATPPQDLNKVVALRAIHGHAATPKLAALQKRGNTPAKSAKKTQDSAKKPPTVKTWSDIVKAGPALPAKPLQRPAVLTKFPAVKKRSPVAVKQTAGKTPKTPRALARALAPTTGHAESPATIIVGKKALGRTRPKTPQPLPRKGRKKSMGKVSRVSLGNVSLTGVAEMFNSPQSSDPNESALYADIPDTPNGPNEMFVSPLSTSKSQLYSKGRQSINLTGVRDLFKNKRKSVDPSLVGVKELMKSPAQRSDVSPSGLKRLMKTPKNTSVSPTGVAELFAAHESSTPVSRKSSSKNQESAKKATVAGSPGLDSAAGPVLSETVSTEQTEDNSNIRKNKTPIKAIASPAARRDSKRLASPEVSENVPLVSSSPVLSIVTEKENDKSLSAAVETVSITNVTEAKGAEQSAGTTPSGKRNRTKSPVSKGVGAITPIKETQTTRAKLIKKVGFDVPIGLENSVTKRGRGRLLKVVPEADNTSSSVVEATVPSKSRNRKTAEAFVEAIPVSAAAPTRGRRKTPEAIEQVPVVSESKAATVEAQVNAAPARGRRKNSAATEQVQAPVPETEVVEKPVAVAAPTRGRRKTPVVTEEVPVITETVEEKQVAVAAPTRGRRKTPLTEQEPVPVVSKKVTEEKPVAAIAPSRGRRKVPVGTEDVPVITEAVEEIPVAATATSSGRRKNHVITESVEEKQVHAAAPYSGRRKNPVITESVEEKQVHAAPPSRGKRKNPVVTEQVPVLVVSESEVAEKLVSTAAPTRGRRKNAGATVDAPVPVIAEVQSRSSKRGSKVIEVEAAAESQTVRKRKGTTEVEAPTKKLRTGKGTVASNQVLILEVSNTALSEAMQVSKSRTKSENNEKISPVKPRGRRTAVSPIKELAVSGALKINSGIAGQEPEVTKARGRQNKADEPQPKSRSQRTIEVPVTETVSIQAIRKGRGKQSAEPTVNIQELPTAEAPPTRNSRTIKSDEVVDVPTITQETAVKRGRGRQAAVSSITEAPKNTPPTDEPQGNSRNGRTKNVIEAPVVEQAPARGKRKSPPETVETLAPEVSAISKPLRQKSKGQSTEAVVAQSKQTNVSKTKRKAVQVEEVVSPPKRRKITDPIQADPKPLETARAKRLKGTIAQEKPLNSRKVKQPTITESSSPTKKQTTRGQKKVVKTTAKAEATPKAKVSLRQRR